MKLSIKRLFTNDDGHYKQNLYKASEVKYYKMKMLDLGFIEEIDFSIQKLDLKAEFILYSLDAANAYVKIVNEA